MSHVRARLRLLSIAVLAVLMHGACSEPAPPPPPAPSPAVKTPQQRVQLYQACWDQFNNQQWEQFQNCYGENAVSEAVDANPPSITGRAAIIERAKLEVAPFPDRRGEVRVLLLNGDRVASVALYTATNSGPLPPGPEGKPVPATNKAIGMLIAHTIELDPTGAHAVREATYVDEGTMMAQLGLSPAPARKAQKATGAPAQVVIAKDDDRERANIEVVRRSFAALNAHDAKGVAETIAPNYKGMDIGMPKEMDRNASMASLKELFTAFPDVKITPVTMWAAGDYVVVTGTFEGTNLGNIPSMGVKKTRKKVSTHFFELFRLENGLCAEDWLFYNGGAFAAQLGLR
jgi:predicted ester cyclase